VALVALASYPVVELVGGGQDSALSLLIWVAGVGLAVRNRSAVAGLVFALGAFKPQLVVLVPLVFLARRQWRGLAAFGGGVGLLAALSWALVGGAGLRSWLAALGSPLYEQQVTIGQAWKMVSVPALAVDLASPVGHGAEPVVGYAVTATLVGVFAWWLWRTRPDAVLAWTAALGVTVVASPHIVVYDAVLLIPCAVLLLDRLGKAAARWVAVTFLVAYLIAPLHLAAQAGPDWLSWADAPWTALPVAGLCLLLLRERVRERVEPPVTSRR
jgi:hypothetical protein